MTHESWQIFYSITNAVRLATLKEAVSNNRYHWQCSISIYLMKTGRAVFPFKVHLWPSAGWSRHSAWVPNWKPPTSSPSFGWFLWVVLWEIHFNTSTSFTPRCFQSPGQGKLDFCISTLFSDVGLPVKVLHRCKLLLRVIHRIPTWSTGSSLF